MFFVAPSEARRDSITRVIAERESSDKYKFPARALTPAEARRVFCRALYRADQPPGTARLAPRSQRPVNTAALAPGSVAEVPARSAAEERLRRGRVSVRGEQLVKIEKLLRSSLCALRSAQEVLNRLGVPRETIPELPGSTPYLLRVLAEYARRGEETLSRHGFTVAD